MAQDQFGGTPVDTDSFGGSLVGGTPPPRAGAIRRLADTGLALAKGVVGVPESMVGLADLATGGRAGKAAEQLGVRFKDAKDYLTGLQSDEQHQADQEVANAQGFLPTLGAMAANPSTIVNAAAESAPTMLTGGGVARGALRFLPKLSPIAAGAIGEGAVAAGQNAEQVRQEDPTGTLTPEQSAILAASGALTGGLSLGAGRVANRLGIGDVQTMLASGKLGPVGAEAVQAGAKKGAVRRLAEGALTEGALQELPQSYQEQVAQNLAQGKPWDEGAGAAGAQGLLVGGLTGAAGGALHGSHADVTDVVAKPPKPDASPLPTPGLDQLNQQEAGEPTVPQSTPPDGAAALAAQQAAAAAQRQAAQDASRAVASPDDEIHQSTGAQPLPDRLASMGINPAGGPMQAAASIAVATGAHDNALHQQAQAAAKPADKGAAAPAPPAAPAPQGAFPTYEAAQQYIAEQKQRGTSVQALPLPQPDGSFGMAMRGTPEYTMAEFHAKQRDLRARGVLDGDVLNKAGDPFSGKGLATIAANRATAATDLGHEVVPVQGGWVVRPLAATQETTNAQTEAQPAATETAPADQGAAPAGAPTPVQPAGDGVAVPSGGAGAAHQTLKTAGELSPAGTVEAVASQEKKAIAAPVLAPESLSPQASGEAKAGTSQDVSGADQTPNQKEKVEPGVEPSANGTPAAAPAQAIDQAAHQAATSPLNDKPQPSEGQKEAGNYAKGHLKLHGLDISIENPRGSTRSGKRPDGSTWSHDMSDHYGYIKRTTGADGEQVDVYVGPKPESEKVFVVDQLDQQTGGFDEHKALVGYANQMQAMRAYRSNFDKGWKVGPVKAMSMDEFKTWLKEGDTTQPATQGAVPDVNQAPEAQQGQTQRQEAPASQAADRNPDRSAGRPAAEPTAPAAVQPEAAGGAGAQPEVAKPAAKKPSLRQRIEAERKARADYFTPGNIVPSYGNGADLVLAYTPPKPDGSDWSVKVRAVVKQDGKWVPDPKDRRDREHSTQPTARELAKGPLERAPKVATAEPAPYTGTDERADNTATAAPATDDGVRGPADAVQRRAQIVGLGIADRIKRVGSTALVGQIVRSPEQLAELAQVYRDPTYETFRVFFTKDGTVVHATGVSARLPGQAPMMPAGMSMADYVRGFRQDMERTGADGYYVLHNHPTGNPTPSIADVRVTEDLAREVPGMLAHVIINSNKYAVISPGRTQYHAAETKVETKEFGEDLLLQASKPMSALGKMIAGPSDLAAIGKSFQKPGYITLIGRAADGRVRMIAEVPTAALSRSYLYLAGMVRRLQRQSGSTNMFAVGAASDIASDPVKRGVASGVLTDAQPDVGQSLQMSGIVGNDNPFKETKGRAVAEDEVAFRRSPEPDTATQAVAQVQQIADNLTKTWKNAPPIVVVPSMQDPRVPERLRKLDAEQVAGGAEDTASAFITREGTVFLIAPKMHTEADVVKAIAHEVLGHSGLRGNFDGALRPILQQMVAMRRTDVAAKADQYGLDMSNKEHALQAAEEVLAEMAEKQPQLGWVQRAIAAIRNWLRANIPQLSGLKMRDNDIIQQFILPARRFVEQGAPAPVARGEAQPAFQRTLAQAANDVHDVNLPAGYKVGDLFGSVPGKLNWWHKKVGTQYNLAQRSPLFKRVYDSVQSFINDVSYHATQAADLAPTLLPKLETWRDITKRPVSAADTKALAGPVFEGTLTWARDAAGKPVPVANLEKAAETMQPGDKAQQMLRAGKITPEVLKMWQGMPITQFEATVNGKYEREMLQPGVVWTDAELRDRYGMTPAQIGLYHEFRAATDKSVTQLAVSDMLRFAGEDAEGVRVPAMDAKTPMEAAEIIRDALLHAAEADPTRSELLTDTATRVIDKADQAQALMDRGYAPLSRFGQYTVDVVSPDGDRKYFGMFETRWDAARMARQMAAEFPDAKVTRGTISQEAYKLFAGVSPETLELFGGMLGLEAQGGGASNEAFQTWLKAAKSTRSAMKRLIERKGIAGFSEDAGRVLAGFVYSNARQTSQNLHMGEMGDAAAAIPQEQGELKDHAVQLVQYIKNPVEEAQALRGLMFAQYIGGSVASAMVNMTQPFTMTLPWLSQYGGASGAGKQMVAAVRDVNKRKTGDAQLDAALKRAEEDGTVSPQEVHQLQQQAAGKGALRAGDGTKVGNAAAAAQNTLSRLQLAWGKAFSAAEQFNRRVTFIAAYRTAVEKGIADPDGFARKAIAETQGIYNKGNKPAWARGAIGATLFTFKQYSISYLEMLNRMARSGPEGRKAALLAVGVLFLLSGASGLPGAGDADDLISGLMQALGYNFDSKAKRKELLAGILGNGGADFVERGISGLPGVPIDVSGRMGLGNLIPGTGLLTAKADHTQDVAEIAGPAGDLAKRAFDAAGSAVQGDIGKAAASLSPQATQNLVKAWDMASTGMYRDRSGKKVIDTDGYDALSKAIGFQPNDVKRVQDATATVQNMVALNKLRETQIADQWAQGLFEKDADKVQAARDALKTWNADNPDSPIRIAFNQVAKRVKDMNMSKEQRIAKTAPTEIRTRVRQELAQ